MFETANISIFAGSGGRTFAERMCAYMGKPLGSSEVITFSEGNTFVRINETVRDRDVFLVQPIGMHSNDAFVEILFWMDAFKRSSALSCTLIMPYFGYGKGDKKDEPRVSIRARVCAESMELAGADRFVTMDLHAPQLQGFFKRPMDHLYAMPMLTEVIKREHIENAVIVSPDAGFAKQARKFADALHLPIAIGDKTRADHSENAGGTLVNLAETLRARGAKEIVALLSHNIISEKGVERVNNSPIKRIYSTDTVENPNIIGQEKFHTVSVAPMFAETIMRYYNYQSVNSMFSKLPENVVEAGFTLAGLEM